MSGAGRGRVFGFSSRAQNVAAPLLLMALILAGWELIVHAFTIPAYVLPPPTAIVAKIFQDWRIIFPHLQVTLFEIIAGYALAAVVGFFLSIAIVYSNSFRRGVLPLIVAAQTIPVIAIAPILVIWFGYNYVPRIIITALVAFFPLTISIVTGLQSLSVEFIDFFRSLNATGFQIFVKLRMPAALPNVFAGLKVATTLAVVGATISEWVGASAGLGYLMAQDSAQLNTTRVFSSLVVLGLCGMAFFASVGLVERLCMPWVYGRLHLSWFGQRTSTTNRSAETDDASTRAN
jgi:ABC-type nitrate/sulfonate/bicarbonate transport system permease component